jgi:SAM-dependent methyltransferase
MVHEAAGQGFQAGADTYATARPSYPLEVIERLVPELGAVVLDLAAGTGIFTRLLEGRTDRLIAAEPVAGMRDRLAKDLPRVGTVGSTAENICFRDAAFSGVVVAQAFHWFDAPTAIAEIHRVLEPGGVLAVIFNIRDDRTDWVARVTEIIDPFEDEVRVPRYRDGAWRPDLAAAASGFDITDQWLVDHGQPMDEDGLVARVASTSFIARLDDERRAGVEAQIRELCATHPELRGRDTFVYPYRCETTLLRKHT